eukprot:TRINITY_DN11210_c0_g1_i1.p1 TRINITY_DN11210_c0_g1~~TRINITY_DN11210_c0_g1_i1.p1  ORF type:complete len:393 (+),score=125.43 TRINITY_DN11210_c0_g1_i1:67-1179(+)
MKATHYSEWLRLNQTLKGHIDLVMSGKEEMAEDQDYNFVKVEPGTNVESGISIKYTVVPLKDHDESQKGVVIVIEDITPQKRVMSTLSRYMSPALAEQVMKEGGDRLGGVHVTVTTLFVDIRNFTAISEAMDAEEVVKMLNEYFEHMVNAVLEEDGVLDKYIGDAVMAVFGIPYAREDDAIRACNAALHMLRNLEIFNKRRNELAQPMVKVGIGINTGRVLSGNIGSDKRMEYTVIGDGVNIASRLEGVTKQYGVKTLISEYTKAAIGDLFMTREIDSITVVGKVKPIRIYELLLGEKEEPSTKTSILEPYAKALQAYREMRWDDAIELFQMCFDVAGDVPSRVLLERCHRFKVEPPPRDWDGVYGMLEK